MVDGALSPRVCEALREEIRSLHSSGAAELNRTVVVTEGASGQSRDLLPKRGVWESDMLHPPHLQAARLLAEVQGDATLRALLSVLLPPLRLDWQGVKAQRSNGEGACFPIHVDSDAAVDGRLLTAVFYLNDNHRAEHGGQLR